MKENKLTQLSQLQTYVQYWDNFNLSLLFILVVVLVYVVGSLHKQPDWKFDEYKKSYKAFFLKYGWRLLIVSFMLNLFVSIWI